MAECQFTFDDQPITARAGQSLAAALTQAGYRKLRQTAGNQARGIFCGMGVCQDCLVTIDGAPNQRACMTKAENGQNVETQTAFPALDPAATLPELPPVQSIAPEVLIIGAGAGGLSAAIAAREAGAEVIVLDERPTSGGQYYKQSATGEVLDAQQAEGAELIAKAEASGVRIIHRVEIWGAFDGPILLAASAGAALVARPRTTIVATGAYERPCMVPGWTLPGVMTTGAAQTLWRSYRTLPGKRVTVCGSGPLNLQLALELAKGGAEIALVAEAAPAPYKQPLVAAQMALAGPALTLKGIAMVLGLRRQGVPVHNSSRLKSIEQNGDTLLATFKNASGETQTVESDVICMNAGFEPQNEILRLLGADMIYDSSVGHLRVKRSATLETSVPGLFAVGDCAGLGGAPAACTEGRIAGQAAAAITGHGSADSDVINQRELRRHRRFQHLLWQLHEIAPPPLANAPAEMILCRCEEVTLGDALAGYEINPGHLGTLKRGTRLGMGRCQGRYCAGAAARLIAEHEGEPLNDRSFFAPRVPIKPVSIAAILAAQDALDEQS